ncbi:MATE family efflux transporter [Novosphingobium sp. PC22D]|uniref:MATE family efflux transporter n=1 Tax=Novosphingobium sp. PC22D TaxID=1962403 RepID=UPI000BF0FC01|nr:MATE family efflux transporter [Novosphingobium sp. PC22D]PEQ13944.1 MATE family efflux transporter [Novosphingobium sp. PC22D]
MNEAPPVIATKAASEGAAPLEAPRRVDAPMKGDLTQGPILKTLLLFAVPMLIGNVIQSLNGSINAIWVGRLIGESALAATANANNVMFLLFSAVFGFGMATTVRVGLHFGARDVPAMRRSFGTGLGFCSLIAIATGLAGWIWTPAMLDALSTPEASKLEALAYLRVIFVTMPLGTIMLLVSMGMRGVGDSKTPLYAMLLTVLLDIVLNPLLISGPGPIPALGIAGSAIATGIANFIGATAMIVVIYRKDLPLRLRGPELRYLIPSSRELAYVVGKGIPMGAQMLIIASAGLVMMGLVNREGLDTAAAYGASLQLWNYIQMPAMALGSGVSTMVAQNVGAGKNKRVGEITLKGIGANVVMTGVLAVLLVVFDRPLLALFLGGESSAIPVARHMQMIVTWSFVLVGVTMIHVGTMRAYGVVILPLIVFAVALYGARLSFYSLLYPVIGSEALWWAFPFGSVAAVALMSLAYVWTRRRERAGAFRHIAD